MSDNHVSGIDEEMLKLLSLALKEYALRLNEKLDQLTTLVERLTPAFNCQTGIIFKSKYQELTSNYGIVKENILSYANDLESVIRSYQTFEKEAAESFGANKVFKQIEYLNDER